MQFVNARELFKTVEGDPTRLGEMEITPVILDGQNCSAEDECPTETAFPLPNHTNAFEANVFSTIE